MPNRLDSLIFNEFKISSKSCLAYFISLFKVSISIALTGALEIQFNKIGEHDLIVFYKNGQEQLKQTSVIVLDEQLCGNSICNENEELTCSQDCKKFELPKIPSWVGILLVVILLAILVAAFIKMRYWY